MEIFDFTVAPGETAVINYEGNYVYYMSGSAGGADATISVRHDATGDRALLLPGQGFPLPEGGVGRRWLVSNFAGQAPIIGRLLVGGRIDDNRISGSVEVIDGERNRALAGGAFLAGVQASAVAGQMAYAQLWNPAGSGKRLVLRQMAVSVGTAGNIYAGFTAAALANSAGGGATSKLQGGALGTGEARWATSASAPAVANWVGSIAAGNPFTFTPAGGLVVNPGSGWTVGATTLNAFLFCNLEWFEESL